MYCLAVDTTTNYLCVVIARDGEVVCEYNRLKERAHSKYLIPVVEKVLLRCGLSIADMDYFTAGIGPGSFTGLRIGIAAVKAMAMAYDKPVVGYSSLELLALQSNVRDGLVCPVIDAKRQQVYSAVYEFDKRKGLRRKGKYLLVPIDDLLKKLRGRILFIGDAVALYRENICRNKSIIAEFAPKKLWYPAPQAVARLCGMLYEKNDIKTADTITPLYMYADTCTVRKASKEKKVSSKQTTREG
ncbi:MAG: tRNA (adenosine(37)-N6)-threonylcarbamoyltransferase complex dimerization subunit type 1 TsaB [Candidatus Omnitrophica bacterium]|nr:tRNA (adenosine(37)-N6)-threonylcarbamoyltransferase complex dimerization subunit type 1 TsaB [Candidatus Omnitrophota bacterium]MCG2703021.1 tRNA (adenosine(37)-N6)-threonylcarbamoyltransferase complex dimerization subunit type 1 TsaB [Candidatus Omnitrophota bacterium]